MNKPFIGATTLNSQASSDKIIGNASFGMVAFGVRSIMVVHASGEHHLMNLGRTFVWGGEYCPVSSEHYWPSASSTADYSATKGDPPRMSNDFGDNTPIKLPYISSCSHLQNGKSKAFSAMHDGQETLRHCPKCFISKLDDLLRIRREEPERIAEGFRFDQCSHRFDRTAKHPTCPICFKSCMNALIDYSSLLYFQEKPHAKLLRRVLHRLGKRAKSLAVMDAATQTVSHRKYSPLSFKNPENVTVEGKRYRELGLEPRRRITSSPVFRMPDQRVAVPPVR